MNLREKMLDVLNTTRVEENYQMIGNNLILISIAAMTKSNVYIVAENDLTAYVRLFKSWGLNVHKVVCVSPKDFQKVDDVEIILLDDLLEDKTPRKFFFIDAEDHMSNERRRFFEKHFNDIPSVETPNRGYLFYEAEKWHMSISLKKNLGRNFISYYQKNKEELIRLFDALADYRSKLALYYHVESCIKNCIYKGEHAPTRWKYFFGDKYEQLYKHLDGECWINCGANIGDTIFSYFSWNFKPKKIYAFEGEKTTFKMLLNNLLLLPADKRALVEPINAMIDETTDFEKILAGNKCTLLNADIEGAELSLLRAMKQIIQNDHPVISVCVYHYKEDLLTIPQFLRSICRDYIFYLRKYTPGFGNRLQTGELVLYAVPKERAL